ncbi:MAG TPA: phosphatidylglycerophosphatase A [Acetobacteraceae bacterium]|nr:phosphatidylglycerophosphatase A [Acetobacteraceae bacterium]
MTFARTFARLVAAGFGVGFVPAAAGTVASLVAVLTGAAMMMIWPPALPAASLLAIFGGFLCVRAARIEGDPGWVVIDEFAGQWLALLALAQPSPKALLAAFVLFRLLDIAKPGPVGWADRHHGALGIMADDVIAGIISAILLLAMQWAWPQLLV